MDINHEIVRVKEFEDKGNYHAAINIAISAMNDCRKNSKQEGVDKFIALIRGVVDTMDGQFGSHA